MELRIRHNNLDWFVVVTDYDYDEGEQGTPPSMSNPGSPDIPEDASITAGYLQYDNLGVLPTNINKQLLERGEGPLYRHILNLYSNELTNKLLDVIHDRQEAMERDYNIEAEEAYQENHYEDYLTKEVEW
jgi:hypothetical protein